MRDNMDFNNDEECKNDQLDKAPTESETTSGLCPPNSTLDVEASLSDTNKRVSVDDLNNNDDLKTGWTGVSGEEENEPTDVDVDKAEPTLNEKEIVDGLKKQNKTNSDVDLLKKPEHSPNIIQLRKGFQTEEKFQEAMTCKNGKSASYSAKINNNNNNDCPADCYDDRNFLLGMEDEGSNNWKNERGGYFDDEEDYRMRFPWKRIAYIGVLLVLGITCAILALMKLCGGADWMNTATFSVIIMGTVMLLPPGLYYGRILICICCRCKEYSLWDVPAGPFG